MAGRVPAEKTKAAAAAFRFKTKLIRDRRTAKSNYRARYYDAQNGRFLSEDPLRNIGSGSNYFEYSANNGVNFKDANGLEYGMSNDNDVITISAAITIYGPAATSALASQWQNAIMQAWNKGNPSFGRCKVKFQIEVMADPSSNWWFTAAQHATFPTNYVYVPAGDDVTTGVNVLTHQHGTWWSLASDSTVAHETGHFFGFGDDYHSFTTLKPYSGHENHMMADNGDHIVAQHEIDFLVSSFENRRKCKCQK